MSLLWTRVVALSQDTVSAPVLWNAHQVITGGASPQHNRSDPLTSSPRRLTESPPHPCPSLPPTESSALLAARQHCSPPASLECDEGISICTNPSPGPSPYPSTGTSPGDDSNIARTTASATSTLSPGNASEQSSNGVGTSPASLQRRIRALRTAARAAEADAASAATREKRAAVRARKAEEALADAEEQVEAVKAELEEEVAIRDARYHALFRENEDALKKETQASARALRLETTLREKEEQADSMGIELQRLGVVESEVRGKEVELEKLRKLLEGKEQRVCELESRVAQTDRCEAKMAESAQAVSRLTGDVEELKGELTGKAERIESLENMSAQEKEEKRKAIEQLELALEGRRKEKKQLENTICETSGRLNTAEGQLEALRVEKGVAEGQGRSALKKIHQLDASTKVLQTEVEDLRKALAEKAANGKAMQDRFVVIEGVLAEERKEKESLAENLRSVNEGIVAAKRVQDEREAAAIVKLKEEIAGTQAELELFKATSEARVSAACKEVKEAEAMATRERAVKEEAAAGEARMAKVAKEARKEQGAALEREAAVVKRHAAAVEEVGALKDEIGEHIGRTRRAEEAAVASAACEADAKVAVGELESKVARCMSDAAFHQGKSTKLRERLGRCEADVEEMRQRAAGLEEQNIALAKSAETAQAELVAAVGKVDMLKAELAERNEQMEIEEAEVTSRLQELEGAVESRDTLAAKLEAQLSEYEQTSAENLVNLNAELKDKTTRIEGMRRAMAEQEDNLTSARECGAVAKANATAAQKRMKELEAERLEHASALQREMRRGKRASEKLRKVEEEVAGLEDAAKLANRRAEAAESAAARSAKEAESAIKEAGNVRAQSRETDRRASEVSTLVRKLEGKLEDVARLSRKQLSSAAAENEQLSKELQAAKLAVSSSEAATSPSAREVEQLQDQMSQLERAAASREEEKVRAEEETAQARRDAATLHDKVISLTRETETRKTQVDAMRAELGALHQRMRRMDVISLPPGAAELLANAEDPDAAKILQLREAEERRSRRSGVRGFEFCEKSLENEPERPLAPAYLSRKR